MGGILEGRGSQAVWKQQPEVSQQSLADRQNQQYWQDIFAACHFQHSNLPCSFPVVSLVAALMTMLTTFRNNYQQEQNVCSVVPCEVQRCKIVLLTHAGWGSSNR